MVSALAGAVHLSAVAAQPELDLGCTAIRDPNTPADTQPRLEVIRIGLKDSEGEINHFIKTDSPAVLDSRRFVLKQDGKTITFKPLLKNVKPPGLVSAILLVPDKALKTGKGLTLEMTQEAGAEPGLKLKDNSTIAKFGPTDLKCGEEGIAFLNRNRAVGRKLSVLGGENGASASIKLTYGMDSLANPSSSNGTGNSNGYDRFWRFQSILDADVSYKPEANHNYINSINAEADYVLAQFFEMKRVGDARGLFETGLSGRFEADEMFDKINLTVGWTNWLSINSPAISKFATGLCFIGKAEANVPPILVFAYDYVSPAKDDLPANNQGEDTGRNRLRGRFYWSIQLAHDADLIIVKHYNADFLIDVGGVYDFESGKALPDVRLSLDIGPQTPDDKAPKFTLSFVNGKTTPTFRNYNALLAGFKQVF